MSSPSAGEVPPPSLDAGVTRSTTAMSLLTLASRLTGVVRIVIAASVLGTTFLGNTYHSANAVPNILFELFAAGALQATLVPTLVELIDSGRRRRAEEVAGSVLGITALGLSAVALAAMAFAPALMGLLVSGVEPAAVREAEVRLGSFLLWFFMPQMALYAAGMVSTAVLNAQGRFALPVFAPVVNNVLVSASYLLFWYMRRGQPPSLDLSLAEKVVLAGGTTLGVAGLCAVPLLASAASGFSLRPRLDFRDPEVRKLCRRGGWAAVYLATTQVLLVVALVLGNRIEGGVVAYHLAFTFFLVPHAVLALPVITALYPRLARSATGSTMDRFTEEIVSGTAAIAFFTLLGSAVLLALAGPVASLALVGRAAAGGVDAVALALTGFAPGLFAYAGSLFLTRAFYALGDARLPALVNAGAAGVGATAMVVGFMLSDREHAVMALALGHSAAYLAGATLLLVLLRRRVPALGLAAVARPVATSALAAALGLVVMRTLSLLLEGLPAALTVVGGLSGGLLVYLAVHRMRRSAIPLPLPSWVSGAPRRTLP